MRSLVQTRRLIGLSFMMVMLSAATAHGSATLLLEEPYGKLGFFTATGHAAVYLSGVCAETPIVLRPCAPGELGAVISRYDGIGHYDWAAIPLIPYLYAVDQTEDIPLFADPKMVSFLRDQYRRKHLQAVAPDSADGATPGGNWYELVGSAYDRAAYAFEIETSAAQDRAFIRAYNASPNRSHFRTVSRNCADFAKDVINFYYPKALHRSIVADVGIATPKQMAKRMVKFSTRHPQFAFSRYVIPQVPGSAARSTAVHGVVESFFKSKKYIVPSAVASPVFAGCVAAVYLGTNADHFDPAKRAMVFNADRELEPPVGAEDRRSYQLELNHLVAADIADAPGTRVEKTLVRMMNNAAPGFDPEGHPILRMRVGDEAVTVGLAQSNLFKTQSSGRLAQQILEARLREELRRGNPPKVSESDVQHDWSLLEKARNVPDDEVAIGSNRSSPTAVQSRWIRTGNRP
ncbi:MAG TPA: hypothetical protein VFF50_14115 [Candidatus Deferrimicrobiaceae bacterium]|nr:hypothetical protein [Candidatus Deferrimicrobiaceae bacterium]